MRGVAAQILLREDAAARTNSVDDRASELALVQHARPVLRDGLERCGEVGLHDAIGWLGPDRRPQRRTGRTKEDALAVAGLRQALVIHREREADVPVDLEPLAGDADRRRHHALAWQATVALMGTQQRRGLTGDAD